MSAQSAIMVNLPSCCVVLVVVSRTWAQVDVGAGDTQVSVSDSTGDGDNHNFIRSLLDDFFHVKVNAGNTQVETSNDSSGLKTNVNTDKGSGNITIKSNDSVSLLVRHSLVYGVLAILISCLLLSH